MRRSLIAAAIALPVAASGIAVYVDTGGPGLHVGAGPALAEAQAVTPQAKVPQSQGQIDLSFAPIVKKTAKSVVNIYTTKVTQRPSPFSNDPFFNQFFQGAPGGGQMVQNALGSGVIVSSDGIVLSNNHVIDGATQIRVVLKDRREYTARVIMADPKVDLAVLKLEGAHNLPAIHFDNSDKTQVGDLVLAIGDPFGVGQTVSSGIVSGLARSALRVGHGQGYYVQTDAPINPGNSGGALVDMKGGLIGINTAILTRGGGSEGIGFAIPSNLAKEFVKQAESGAKHFTTPWAGVTAQGVDSAAANSLGLPRPEGVLLADVSAGGPFAKAGLKQGDVVLAIDHLPVNSPQQLRYRLEELGTGGTADVSWLRNGKTENASFDLIAPPNSPAPDTTTITSNVLLRGATISRINPEVSARMGLPPDSRGVVVVKAKDLAAQVGLQPGDIIKSINSTPISTPADVKKAMQDQTSMWQFDLVRDGHHIRMRFRI